MLIKKITDTNGLVTTTFLNTNISEVDNEIPDTKVLVATTILNTKISDVENKIPSVSCLVKKTDYDAKIKDIQGKYCTTADYKKFTCDILEFKIKLRELFIKSNIDKKLIKINKVITSNKTKRIEADKFLLNFGRISRNNMINIYQSM